VRKPHPVVQICKLDNADEWQVVSNPTDRELEAALFWLGNSFNEYLEYLNCGVQHRFIRRRDLRKYIKKEL
jgi:hypothetical protein